MKKTIPIGVSTYHKMRKEDYYFVDKSDMIREFLERKNEVTLITRPRRFGKTINMSMLAEFFDITKDSKALFEDTIIAKSEYAKEMNQYPMIFLSFANCKGDAHSLKMNVFDLLQIEMGKYYPLIKQLPKEDNLMLRYERLYHSIMNSEDFTQVQLCIKIMCELLYKTYDKAVMLFIDEYDTPFIEAHVNGCYEEIHSSMAGMLSSALKNNPYLKYAMLTGIQRIAKENIFSGLNNLKVYTVKDKEYAKYFGFTKEETKELLEYFDMEYGEDVKGMYDGYRIGDVDIYNPWSIVNYACDKILCPYWVNTSANTMIKQAMEKSDHIFHQEYETLIQAGSVDVNCNLETSFYEEAESATLWGLFLNAGYLTVEKVLDAFEGKYRLRIPNREVAREFRSLTMDYLHQKPDIFNKMMEGLCKADPDRFIENYRHFLMSAVSYHDLMNENSCHSLLLGMCAYLSHDYTITSNREAGKGRYDILLQAKRERYPSYVIELKYVKQEEYEKHPSLLEEQCDLALKQIKDNRYDYDLKGDIIHIALAHCKKDVEMKWIKKVVA